MHEIELMRQEVVTSYDRYGQCCAFSLLHFTNPVQKISFDSKLMDDGSISGRWIHHESILLSSDPR